MPANDPATNPAAWPMDPPAFVATVEVIARLLTTVFGTAQVRVWLPELVDPFNGPPALRAFQPQPGDEQRGVTPLVQEVYLDTRIIETAGIRATPAEPAAAPAFLGVSVRTASGEVGGVCADFATAPRVARRRARGTHRECRAPQPSDSLPRRAAREQALRLVVWSDEHTVVLNTVGDAVTVVDAMWRIVYANEPMLTQIIGRHRAVIEEQLWTLLPRITSTPIADVLRRAMLEQRSVMAEWHDVPGAAWLEVRAFPLPQGLSIFIRDITDRVQAQAALRESEARFRATVDSSLAAFFILQAFRDKQGAIGDFEVRELNTRAETLLQRSRQAAIGQPLSQLCPVYVPFGFFDANRRVLSRLTDTHGGRRSQPVTRSAQPAHALEIIVSPSGDAVLGIPHRRRASLRRVVRRDVPGTGTGTGMHARRL